MPPDHDFSWSAISPLLPYLLLNEPDIASIISKIFIKLLSSRCMHFNLSWKTVITKWINKKMQLSKISTEKILKNFLVLLVFFSKPNVRKNYTRLSSFDFQVRSSENIKNTDISWKIRKSGHCSQDTGMSV